MPKQMTAKGMILLMVTMWCGGLYGAAARADPKQERDDLRPRLVVQTGHSEHVTCGQFSPDGRQLLTGSSDGTARLWDTATGRELRVFAGHKHGVEYVAYTPDARHVITACGDKSVQIWDSRSGQAVREIVTDWYAGTVALSGDGKRLATRSLKGIQLWDLSTGSPAREFEIKGYLPALLFSPDGRKLIAGVYPGSVHVLDAASGELLRRFDAHGAPISSLSISSDGTLLLTSGHGEKARLWDMSSGREVGEFGADRLEVIEAPVPVPPMVEVELAAPEVETRSSGETLSDELLNDAAPESWEIQERNCAALSSDGKRVLTASSNLVRVWDARTGKPIRDLDAAGALFEHVALSPEGNLALLASFESVKGGSYWTELWNLDTGELVHSLHGNSKFVQAVAFASDQKRIVTGSYKSCTVWNLEAGDVQSRFESGDNWCRSVSISPDGRYVSTLHSDDTAFLWSADRGEKLAAFGDHYDVVVSAAISRNGRLLLAGYLDGAIRLWETKTCQLVRKIDAHKACVFDVAFAPDGIRAVSCSDDGIVKAWDLRQGKELAMPLEQADETYSVAFSPDGNLLATAGADGTVRLWDAATWGQKRVLLGHQKAVGPVVFSPDGNRLATVSDDGTARVWDVSSGKTLRSFGDQAGEVWSASFSGDGRQLLTAGEDRIARLWNVASGGLVHELRGHHAAISAAAFSPDGEIVLTVSEDCKAILWDSRRGTKIREIAANWGELYIAAFSPDGRWFAVGGEDGLIKLWDSEGKEEIGVLSGVSRQVSVVDFSPDSQRLAMGYKDGHVEIIEVGTGRLATRLSGPDHPTSAASLDFSRDGKRLLVGMEDGLAVRLMDLASGGLVREIQPKDDLTDGSGRGIFSPDDKYVVTKGIGRVHFWDSRTGKPLSIPTTMEHPFTDDPSNASPSQRYLPKNVGQGMQFLRDGHGLLTTTSESARLWQFPIGRLLKEFHPCESPASLRDVTVSPDGRWLLTADSQGMACLWEISSGDYRCTLIPLVAGAWCVVDRDGRFDAANGGQVDGLHWVIENEPLELEQLKDRYYEPNLLAKIMGFDLEPMREVRELHAPELHPEVELGKPTAEDPVLTIRLKNRGGGIGRVSVTVNGKEITADARGTGFAPDAAQAVLTVNLAGDSRIVPGEQNVIEVNAYNAEGYLRSRGLKVLFSAPGERDSRQPRLWGLIVGVGDYRGHALDLRYAAKDAADYAAALRVAATRLFGPENVRIAELTTFDPSTRRPTRANITRALEIIAQHTAAADIVVIYLAGHGVNYGGQDGDFYFLTSEASTGDLIDPAVREQTAISSRELTHLIKEMPARKQVMILDTCSAGRFIDELTGRRFVPSSQVRALERLKDRTGLHILAGCAADRVSYEASRYGQGLLTYSLLMGMRGAALREGQFVDVGQLFGFAADQVPLLAHDIGGIQRPLIAVPTGGSSFDIGRVAEEDKRRIPIVAVRPIVLRTSFQDEDRVRDHLDLAAQVNEHLREAATRSGQSGLVFVDADEFPGAWELRGRYRVRNGRVTVTVLVFQGNVELARFDVSGETATTAELAVEIVRQAESRLKAAEPRPSSDGRGAFER
jgi:WD40 repeat protein